MEFFRPPMASGGKCSESRPEVQGLTRWGARVTPQQGFNCKPPWAIFTNYTRTADSLVVNNRTRVNLRPAVLHTSGLCRKNESLTRHRWHHRFCSQSEVFCQWATSFSIQGWLRCSLQWRIVNHNTKWRQFAASISQLGSNYFWNELEVTTRHALIVLRRTIRAYWSKRQVVTSSSFQN